MAVARLLLHGRIDHIQTAWTKVGLRTAQLLLQGGADDLGGLLMDGKLMPTAGAETFRALSVVDVERIASEIGRPTRQRTTGYGEVAAETSAPAPTTGDAAVIRSQLPLRDRSSRHGMSPSLRL